jgi:hypothetical protein
MIGFINTFFYSLSSQSILALSLIYPLHTPLGHAKSSQSSLVVSLQRIYNNATVTTAHIKSSFRRLSPLYSFVLFEFSFSFYDSFLILLQLLTFRGYLLPTTHSESESYVTTDGQSASLSWNKAPILSLQPDLYYCLTVAGLLIWGALSDERTGLSFAIAPGLRQRSYFRVRVP